MQGTRGKSKGCSDFKEPRRTEARRWANVQLSTLNVQLSKEDYTGFYLNVER
jgi:hypothetical protein